jgi:hypothetical protein
LTLWIVCDNPDGKAAREGWAKRELTGAQCVRRGCGGLKLMLYAGEIIADYISGLLFFGIFSSRPNDFILFLFLASLIAFLVC